MSKVTYGPMIEKMQGRMSKRDGSYMCFRFGVAVQSHYPLHKDPAKITDAQRANSNRFGELSALAKIEREDAVRGPLWRAAFEKQLQKPFKGLKQYRKYDSFVAAMLSKGVPLENFQ